MRPQHSWTKGNADDFLQNETNVYDFTLNDQMCCFKMPNRSVLH